MTAFRSILHPLSLLSLLLISCSAFNAAEFEAGTATNKVVALNKANFKLAIQDPANPFWLLKFYAPWCGHCKRLAPVLDKVAPKLAGKMAIGTIDCTVEKGLCNQHSVRGYPTLKFAIDGEILGEYSGGRSERDFVAFASKMLRPVVEMLPTVDAAKEYAAVQADEGVAFLAYHPAVVESSSNNLDAMLQSTTLTQVFAQVARRQRGKGSFLLLDTSGTKDDESAAAVAAAMGQDGPFVCRLEANVDSRCYAYPGDDAVKYNEMLSWVETQNIPTVSALGAHNFKSIGRRGRPLVIAAVAAHMGDELQTAKTTLTRYAINGDEKIRDKYYYGTIDGNVWKRFLEQFDVYPKDTPQIFILDMNSKQYWQNATYKLNVDDFLQAVEDGIVEAKSAGPKGMEGVLVKVYNFMIAYRPWSLVLVVLMVVAFGVLICKCIKPGEDLRPPYPREPEKSEKEEEEPKEKPEKEEGKKEK